MKQIINKIKEKDNVIFFGVFFLISLGISLNIYLDVNDEIWNFQNIYKMYCGSKIYDEINVIITPLFFWINEVIFHIFGANLFVFRIGHSLMITILFLITYKILKKLKIPKNISMLVVIFIVLQQFFMLIRVASNYNILALLFFIIGIYFLLNEKTRKNIQIQAIITILIILTKQTIGISYLLGNIIYICLLKKDKKEIIKQFLKYMSIVLAGGLVFIIYLIIDNNLLNFLNYTLGGITEFANKNFIYELSSVVYLIGITLINIIISILFMKKQILDNNQKEIVKILFIFSIMLSCVCYPIFNWTHIIMGTYLMIINITYMIYLLFKEFEDKIICIVKVINTFIILIMIIFSCLNICSWFKYITSNEYPYSWKDPFFGGIIVKEEYEHNEKIIKYIQQNQKNVIMVSDRAALYMVPLKKNNGDFDLPFRGNLGSEGENGLIKKVEDMKNTQFLIYKNKEDSSYQESEKVKEYIKNTKKYVGEIEEFEIYE